MHFITNGGKVNEKISLSSTGYNETPIAYDQNCRKVYYLKKSKAYTHFLCR